MSRINISDELNLHVEVRDIELFRYIDRTFEPEEVFSSEHLDKWAVENGYVKKVKNND